MNKEGPKGLFYYVPSSIPIITNTKEFVLVIDKALKQYGKNDKN